MIEHENPANDKSTPALGPGDRLQAARISIGLTIEDVAHKMHLSESILSSLEDNDFDDITAPIFVKGYLRSYARIVNVDENDIIQQYASFYTEDDPPISSTSNTSPEINADDARVKWITWLVILGLVALLALWWWNRYQQPAQPLSLESTESTGELAQNAPSDSILSADLDSGPVDEQKADDSLSQQVQADLATLSEQVETPVAEPVIPRQPPQPEPVPMAEPEITQPEPASAVEAAVESTEMSASEATVEPASEPAVDSDGLVVTVSADTWTDIRDADGNKLIYDLLRSGEKITVNGKAPIRAFFGNGYGVSMKYNGKDIDLSTVIRADNTAKIRIGQ